MPARKAAAAPRVREPGVRYRVVPDAAPASGKAPEQRRALLDVNVLIALLDADHIHHQRASQWLSENIAAGWASCAITQNGCVRIMSQPGYPNALPAARVAQRLRAATATDFHRFLPDDLSLLDGRHFDTDRILGHRQVTDAYLLGLAVSHGFRFATLDGNLAWRVVRAASEHDIDSL